MMNKLSRKQRIVLGFSGVFFLFCCGVFPFLMSKRDDVRIIPLDFSVFPDKPLANVIVESKKTPLLVDLGSHKTFGFHSSVMDSISDKKFVESSFLMDPKGDIYKIEEFIIPSLRIGSYTYEKVPAYEESPGQITEGGFLCGLGRKIGPMRGRIGRLFFANWTCFFDCPNRRILLAPTIDSLTTYVHLEKFTPIPFELHSQGIVLSLLTDLGMKKFILDTGATGSLMKPSLIPEKLMEETNAPLKGYTTSTLAYNDQDFGPWPFWLYEICPEFETDGILGIDFFSKHLVVIDFEHSTMYLGKNESVLLARWNLFLKAWGLR